MTSVVVCVFNSGREAEAARAQLRDHGFDSDRIQIRTDDSASEPPPGVRHERHGLAGVIENMFSGLLIDDRYIGGYTEALSAGKSVVVVYANDDDAAKKAASILESSPGELGTPQLSHDDPSPPAHLDISTPPCGVEAIATLSGPRIFPLPNSPTGWGDATRGEKNTLGERPNDPAQPEGLVRDAKGPGTDDVQRTLAGRKAAASPNSKTTTK